jgi:hypothetical protein
LSAIAIMVVLAALASAINAAAATAAEPGEDSDWRAQTHVGNHAARMLFWVTPPGVEQTINLPDPA